MEEQNKATVTGNQKRRREEDETTAESSRNTYRKKRYSCSKCDLKTDGLEYFRNHVANHGSKQKFTCPHCDFSNHRIQGVVIHLKMRHTSQATSSSEGQKNVIVNMTCAPAENLWMMPAAAINQPTESGPDGKVHNKVVELIDDVEEPIRQKKPNDSVQHQNDEQPVMNTFCNIAVRTNLTEGHVNQLSLEMVEKEEKSCQSEIVKLRSEIDEKLRFLEAHKVLYYRERVKSLTSRKVELILLASKLEKGSAEYADAKREKDKVEEDFEVAVIKQSSFSTILEELDTAPGRVRLLQPGEVLELQDSVCALIFKLEKANECFTLISKRKRALEEKKLRERFVNLINSN